MVSFPTTGVYAGYIDSKFGTLPLSEQEQIWNEFIQTYGYTTAAPPQQSSLTDQANFLAFTQNISPGPVPFPTSGIFSRYMTAFFGNLSPPEQQSLWNQFISNNGYTATNPPKASSITDQEKFIQFAESTLLSNQTLALSPAEVQKRAIMFTTFNVLLSMLSTMQNTVSTEGNNLIFLGKWQEQYTNAMAGTPTYVGGTTSTPSIPTTVTQESLNQFTLGYDNISIQTIINTMAYYQSQKQAYSFTISNVPPNSSIIADPAPGASDLVSGETNPPTSPPTTPLAITFSTDANGVGSITMVRQVVDSQTGTFATSPSGAPDPRFLDTGLVKILIQPSQNANLTTSYSQNVNNFENGFMDFWSGSGADNIARQAYQVTIIVPNAETYLNSIAISQSTTIANVLPTIPWIHTFTSNATTDPDQTTSQNQSKARAEYNARDQQYIQNLTGYRTIIQNIAQQVQSNLSTSKDAISNQANTLDNIITSLQSLIASIFK